MLSDPWRQALAKLPLYRLTEQNPKEVFKPNGKLISTNALRCGNVSSKILQSILRCKSNNDRSSLIKNLDEDELEDELCDFSIKGHLSCWSTADMLVSTTRSLEYLYEFMKEVKKTNFIDEVISRGWVYVIDSQPQGRETYSVLFKNHMENFVEDEVEYPTELDYMESTYYEHEVSVPGHINAQDIRGVIPVKENKLDFDSYMENPVYRHPNDWLRNAQDNPMT